jgi:hypothetical protein
MDSRWSRGSAVGIATGYLLDYQGAEVRAPVKTESSLMHSVKTETGVHPEFCPMAAGAHSQGIKRPKREANQVQENVIYSKCPICHYGIVLR